MLNVATNLVNRLHGEIEGHELNYGFDASLVKEFAKIHQSLDAPEIRITAWVQTNPLSKAVETTFSKSNFMIGDQNSFLNKYICWYTRRHCE